MTGEGRSVAWLDLDSGLIVVWHTEDDAAVTGCFGGIIASERFVLAFLGRCGC